MAQGKNRSVIGEPPTSSTVRRFHCWFERWVLHPWSPWRRRSTFAFSRHPGDFRYCRQTWIRLLVLLPGLSSRLKSTQALCFYSRAGQRSSRRGWMEWFENQCYHEPSPAYGGVKYTETEATQQTQDSNRRNRLQLVATVWISQPASAEGCCPDDVKTGALNGEAARLGWQSSCRAAEVAEVSRLGGAS